LAAALTLASAAAFAGGKNIVETAAYAGNFKTLVTAVKAAGLDGILTGEGPFTVFAPNDDAFSKLPAGTVDDLLKPENKRKLSSILTYHVVSGKVMSKDVAGKMKKANSVEGAAVSIDATGKAVMVDKAIVIEADIGASNGVIHLIDRVIMAPSK